MGHFGTSRRHRSRWRRFPHVWLPSSANRPRPLLWPLGSFPPPLSSLLPRPSLVRFPAFWSREFWIPPPPPTLRKPAVCSASETVLLESTVSRTSRQRRWWNSAPV